MTSTASIAVERQVTGETIQRAMGLLALDQGESYQAVAKLLQVTCTTGAHVA